VKNSRPNPALKAAEERVKIGLCADCRHMRIIKSDRGSVFYRCERSDSDPAFPKYPRLPVVQCRGYEVKVTD
jgi:hypothetical protein